MMLAMALNSNRAQHDHIVISGHILKHAREHVRRIFIITGEPFFISIDHALGRVFQAFAVWIVTGPGQQCLYGGLGFGLARAGEIRDGLEYGLGFFISAHSALFYLCPPYMG